MICTIKIHGEVTEGTFERVRKSITLGASELVLDINSPGGLVSEGFLVRNWVRDISKRMPTKAIISEQSASIATIIALACDTSEMYVTETENNFYLVHNPFLDGQLPCNEIKCDADFFLELGADLKELENEIFYTYLNRCNIDKETLKNLMVNEVRLTPAQALEYGFIDKLIENKTTKRMTIYDRISSFFAKKENVQKILETVANLDIALADGKTVYVETGDGEIEGKAAFDAETGEPMADGSYPLIDGRMITVSGGMITSVSEMEDVAPVENEAEPMEAEAENENKEEQKMENLTPDAINKIVADAVAKALQDAKASSKNPTAPVSSKPLYAPRKAAAPHKFDNVANFIKNKWKPESVKNAIIDPNYTTTWTGEWVEQILIQPALQTPDFMRIFTVIDGVRYQQVLSVAQILGKVTVGYRGCGTPTATGDNTTITDRVLQTAVLEIYLEQCANDFNNTILMLWQKKGINRPDLTGTELESIMLQLIIEAMQRDLFALFSFGDTGLNLTTNPNFKYYNGIDGLWTKLLQDASTASESAVQKFANITTLNQNASTCAEAYLREMYENSPTVLRQMPPSDKAFFVTENIYNNYLTTLEARSGVEGAWIMLQDGARTLSYRGIPVIPITAWDYELDLTDNPLNGTYNTLMLYTTPKNHYIGIDGAQNEVRSWYDPNTDYNKFRAMPVMGYEYVMAQLQSIKVGLV